MAGSWQLTLSASYSKQLPKLTGELTSALLSYSRGVDSRQYILPARLLLPALPPSPPPPPLSPHSPSSLTFNQRDYKLTETESQAQPSQQYHSQTAGFQTWLKHPQWRGAWAAWSQLTQKERPRQRAYPEEANGVGDSRKTTETETRWSLATVDACTVPGWSIPGKILIPTNQITAPSVHSHVSRELRVRALQAPRGI